MAFPVDPKLIENLPVSILEGLPAGSPPPGVESNFDDPVSRVPVILGVGISFLSLALVCMGIRIYTKVAITKGWKWDDVTCSLGLLFGLVYFAIVFRGCTHGAAGRHIWDVTLARVLNKSSLLQSYITTITVTPALGLIKGSLFIQFYQLFHPFRWLRICVWIGATVSTLFYFTTTIAAFILTSPWPGESLLGAILSEHYFKFEGFSIPTGVVGMVVDFYLLVLPIRAVWSLKMTTTKKLGVLIVFLTGAVASVASIVSLCWRIKLHRSLDDPTWDVGFVLLFAQIEMFAGVAASSMPVVSQFMTHKKLNFSAWKSSFKSSLTNLLGSSNRERPWGSSPTSKDSSRHKSQPSDQSEEYSKHDLESGRLGLHSSHTADSQIRLTKDISVVQEERWEKR